MKFNIYAIEPPSLTFIPGYSKTRRLELLRDRKRKAKAEADERRDQNCRRSRRLQGRDVPTVHENSPPLPVPPPERNISPEPMADPGSDDDYERDLIVSIARHRLNRGRQGFHPTIDNLDCTKLHIVQTAMNL